MTLDIIFCALNHLVLFIIRGFSWFVCLFLSFLDQISRLWACGPEGLNTDLKRMTWKKLKIESESSLPSDIKEYNQGCEARKTHKTQKQYLVLQYQRSPSFFLSNVLKSSAKSLSKKDKEKCLIGADQEGGDRALSRGILAA